MKRFMVLIISGLLLLGAAQGEDANNVNQSREGKVRFVPLAVYIDSGDQPLAAYQFELKAIQGQVKIVGVEGGEAQAFQEPPYYDPAALMHNRIIIAAFNTGQDLPQGKSKVAVVHFEVIGQTELEFSVNLMVAAGPDGKEISASVSVVEVLQEEPTHP